MRLLHLSDTHLLGDPDARHYERIDTAAALRGLLDRLDLTGLDLIVHTGDASEDGSEASYRLLHEILDPVAAAAGAPLMVAMGNHDAPGAYAAVRGPGDRGDAVQDRVLVLPGGGRVVVLDSSVPGAGYGRLDPEQLAWLREVLAEPAPAGPAGERYGTILALHHPPLPAATPLLEALSLQDPIALAEAVAGGDVRLILGGHYHHPMSGELAGIPVQVAPGVTTVMDPLAPDGIERAHALSGATRIELAPLPADGPAPAPRVATTVLPSAGDTLGEPSTPAYRYEAETVAAIIAAAGPPRDRPTA